MAIDPALAATPARLASLAWLTSLADECGFTATAKLNGETLKVRPEVRDACASGRCKAYGKNWSCPPACGSLEDCEKRLRQHSAGLILQSTGRLEDAFDYEAMQKLGAEHNRRLQDFQEKAALLFTGVPSGAFPPFLLLGSGGCTICEPCGCPDSPCRFPGKMIVSMEAMGLPVSEVCKANNIPYYYGPGALTYVACVLLSLTAGL